MTDLSYEDDEIGVICVACSHEVKKTVGWLRKHIQLECPNCGAMADIGVIHGIARTIYANGRSPIYTLTVKDCR